MCLASQKRRKGSECILLADATFKVAMAAARQAIRQVALQEGWEEVGVGNMAMVAGAAHLIQVSCPTDR